MMNPRPKTRLCLIALLAITSALVSSDSASAQSADCCLRGTSFTSSYFNSLGTEGDERFFTVKGAPPNVMFLLDTSRSMLDLSIPNYEAAPYDTRVNPAIRSNAGCANPTYDAIISAGGFAVSRNYPPIDLGVDPAAWSGDSGFPGLFKQDKYYVDRDPQKCCGGSWSEATATEYTKGDACALSSNPGNCKTCMDIKGYYLDPGSIPLSNMGDNPVSNRADVFSGKFLNFYPPKYLAARTTLKRVIWSIRNVRLGLSIFDYVSGATLVSKMNPPCQASLDANDSSWTNNRKSLINTINNPNTVPFNAGTPLAEALLNVGQYFTTDDSVYDGWFGSGWTKNSFRNDSVTSEGRSVCFGCQVSSVAIITDGAPDGDNCVPECIARQDPTCPGCSASPRCLTSLGACPKKCGSGTLCKSQNSTSCCQESENRLDGVAKWLYENDLQTKNPNNAKWSADGRQRLLTYTIGFGVDHPLLLNTAAVGGGQYYTANDRASLEAALLSIVNDVNRRATTFGVSSISTLQTSSGMSTLVPRFVPGRAGEDWRGYLYRFELGNELVNGCHVTLQSDEPHPLDLNGDHKCDGIFYVDAEGDVIDEDGVTGAFLKRGTNLSAKPLWEAGRALSYAAPTYAEPETSARADPDQRNLWTVVDSNSDGRLDQSDTMVKFHRDNAATLMGYMNIGTDVTADPVCAALYTKLGVDPATSPLSTWGEACAVAIIDHYRGKRSLDPDPTKRSLARPWMLADIFHSSPVLVEPPVAPDACFLFQGQCIPSLYTYEGKKEHPEAKKAYVGYVQDADGPCGNGPCEKRPALVLVGSNGGFLHAFDAGRPRSPEAREPYSDRLIYDHGNGKEVWGFIPPDLLGSLKLSIGRHGYFVDGTAMVRDMWVDHADLAQGDGLKAKSEFRTVAIVGERSGGQHFFALDITRNVDASATPKPTFLWMWPQPCDARATQIGDTWSNFYPKPPPIGPVLLKHPGGFDYQYRLYDPTTTTWSSHSTKAKERWIAMLNGGNDRAMVRGRGFAVVDAYTGRTYWDEFFEDPALTGSRVMNGRLRYPISAGAGMIDVGPGEFTEGWADGYFDTATFGDMGGNVWLARFYAPGIIDSTTDRVTNWSFARAFQSMKSDGASMTNRRPISYITTNALQPETKYLRTYFGTGDRGALLDTGGGTCSLDNLPACVAMGCDVDSQLLTKNLPSGLLSTHSKWSAGQMVKQVQAPQTCTDCTNACTQARVDLQVSVSNCPGATTTGATSFARAARVDCSTPDGGSLNCAMTESSNSELTRSYLATTSVPKHKYFGVHTFGAGQPPKIFNDASGAETFDQARLTESSPCGSPPVAGCLTNLGTLSAASGQTAGAEQAGWFVSYDNKDERTASPSGIAPSQDLTSYCVIWNSMTPSASGAVCAGSGSQEAKLIQADYVTGSQDCAGGFEDADGGVVRYVERTVLVPPPEPTAIITVSGGKIGYGMVTAEPGRNPDTRMTASDYDMLQSLYQLELSNSEHVCRHVSGGNTCAR